MTKAKRVIGMTELVAGSIAVTIEGPMATVRVDGVNVVRFSLLSSCHGNGQTDVVTEIGSAEIDHSNGQYEVKLTSRSSVWQHKAYYLRLADDRIEYWFTLEGPGCVYDCEFFRGYPSDSDSASEESADNVLRSRSFFASYFNPEPNACRQHYFAADERSTIGIRSDKAYYRGNWFFTPGPLCYALKANDKTWLTAGLVVPPGKNDFVEYEFQGGDTLGLRLRYEGVTFVEGNWESPHVVFSPARDEYTALACYCDYLRNQGYGPRPHNKVFDWWREPIFCGWGEQCWLAVADGRAKKGPEYATQANYEQFVHLLDERGLRPGTIIIDDKWQDAYGDPRPDLRKWPDLGGFIARQHERGQRVLLWLKAWDCEGVPIEESLIDEAGQAVGVDPANPAYERRLRQRVRELLAIYGADGFKLDFTHILPRNVRRKKNEPWGVELLHRLLAIIYSEAKAIKEDALIIAHSINPYFADVVDMARLNDVVFIPGRPELDDYVESMVVRHKVARAVFPDWLIDADNWPSPTLDSWLAYVHRQPDLGVPSLYYLTHIDESGEEIKPEDVVEVTAAWERYRRLMKGEGRF